VPPSEPSPVLYIIACGGRPAQFGHTIRVDRPADAGPVERDVAAIAGRLVASARARGLTWAAQASPVPEAGDVGIIQRADGRKEQSFHLIDGVVFQVRDGELIPSGKQGKELAELTSLIRLRDAAVDLLDAEADHGRGDESLVPLRSRLNTAYDRYVAAYGPLNRATISSGEPDPETGIATVTRRRPRMGRFRQDPDYITVLALENYDDEAGHAAKAAIFSQRVNRAPSRPTSAGSHRAGHRRDAVPRRRPPGCPPGAATRPGSRDGHRGGHRRADPAHLRPESSPDQLPGLPGRRPAQRSRGHDARCRSCFSPRRAAPGTHQAGLRTGRIPR